VGGPWLRDVAGLSPDAAATVMFFVASAIIVGYGLGGVVADRLMRLGVRHGSLLTWGVAVFLLVQVPLLFNVTTGSSVLWVAFTLLGTNSILGFSFLTRQFWGWMADRVGGLKTILAGSVCQAAAVAGLLVTQDEVGLFVVAAAFGAGFSGIIPAYVISVRELFPASEASWRMPVWFFTNLCGMTLGGWLAGHVYDQLASYAPAFATGLVFNLGNVAVIGWMVLRQQRAPAAAG